MTAAHVLHGGPLEGKVIMMTRGGDNYPAELRLIQEPDNPAPADPIVIHVYGLNRGHSADVRRPQRPTYHYSHTKTI